MAKSKKVRSKKYNPKQALDNTALTIAQNAIERIAFVGSSIRRLAPYGGLGFHYTTTRQQRMVATDMLVTGLFENDRRWNIWIAHLYNENGNIAVESAILSLDDYNLVDFAENIDHFVNETKPEDAEGDYFGYAIYAAPNDHFDLQAMDEGLTENFMASGILDKTQHLSLEDRKVNKEDMLMQVVMDRPKFDVTAVRRVDDGFTYTQVEK